MLSIVTVGGSLKRPVKLCRTRASVSGSEQPGGTMCVRSQTIVATANTAILLATSMTARRSAGRRCGRNSPSLTALAPCADGWAEARHDGADRSVHRSTDESSAARSRQYRLAIPYSLAAQPSLRDPRAHCPPMIGRPAHLGPVLDARFVER